MKRYLLHALCLNFFIFGAFAGTGSTGGGNAVGLDLLDFVEAEDLQCGEAQKIFESDSYLEYVEPKLAELEKGSLALATKLRENLKAKPIYFTDKELDRDQCLNTQGMLVQNNLGVVACQDKEKIVIKRQWWDANQALIDSGNEEERARGLRNQGGLLMHEALVSEIVEFNPSAEKKQSMELAVRQINQLIDQDATKNLEKVRKIMAHKLDKHFPTTKMSKALENFLNQRFDINQCLVAAKRGMVAMSAYIEKLEFGGGKNKALQVLVEKNGNLDWESANDYIRMIDMHARLEGVRYSFVGSETDSTNFCHSYQKYLKNDVQKLHN